MTKDISKNEIQRKFNGTVVSDRADKTIVVAVKTEKLHLKYLKRFSVIKKYKVHDPKNQYKVGQTVTFVGCRPMSKDKKWRVLYNA
ncbi:MAG: 30S ribosomal protein S17 [Candidatus Buchananbacteria bacterium RIFCSPHIGHO2_02_FULL_38_8]|uniref:30S ribosomal protein S17 n=2 Tax=Candidatus Buchananiibacteriota TaxID=1817903 RepID=A0A1G1XZN9_9BACT|nr:MAG: 30S ribosomal protein S17 [Candidatus Buchananbacteria bacterium RIFCSPHIGHO2_01_FULL_39_8]OGY47540.1 MAG: 30S ribosomal protein S17 [Candidatus Buchananbacteria bacterium RIFCSPHIGHO2_02_FULL_38_8]